MMYPNAKPNPAHLKLAQLEKKIDELLEFVKAFAKEYEVRAK